MSVYSYGCGVLVVFFYIKMCDGAVHCGIYLFNRDGCGFGTTYERRERLDVGE